MGCSKISNLQKQLLMFLRFFPIEDREKSLKWQKNLQDVNEWMFQDWASVLS